MALKNFKPMTPGQRGLVLTSKSELYKGQPLKKLVEGEVLSEDFDIEQMLNKTQMGGIIETDQLATTTENE